MYQNPFLEQGSIVQTYLFCTGMCTTNGASSALSRIRKEWTVYFKQMHLPLPLLETEMLWQQKSTYERFTGKLSERT